MLRILIILVNVFSMLETGPNKKERGFNKELEGVPLCQTENCTRIDQFLAQTELEIKITKNSTIAHSLSINSRSVKAFEITVMRKSKFCSYGILKNEGCDYVQTEEIIYDKESLIKMSKEKSCKVGRQCRNGGDCVASDALACKSRVMDRWLPRVDDNYNLINSVVWTNVLHDTCEQAFSCLIHELNLEVAFEKKSDGSITHSAKYGSKLIPLEYGEVFHGEAANGAQLLIESTTSKDDNIKMDCLRDELKTICMALESTSSVGRGEVFLFNSMGEHLGDTVYLKISSESKQIDVEYETALKNLLKGGAASVKDLTKVALQLSFENAQSKFNSLVLANSNYKLKQFLTTLVKHLTKSNPGLLGSLLGQKSWTHWVNEDVAIQCPCLNLKAEDVDCWSKYVYREGNYYLRSDSDMCISSNHGSSNVTLMNDNITLSLDTITMVDFKEISLDEMDPDKLIVKPKDNVQPVVIDSSLFEPLYVFLEFLRKWSFLGTLYCLFTLHRVYGVRVMGG
nr:MAG: hemagglutinin [Bat faecal associated orthomyxo-like virus 1]